MKSLSKKVLLVLLVVATINQLEIGVLLPLIPNLFVNGHSTYSFLSEGISSSLGYVLMSMGFFFFAFAQFLSSPVLGQISDYIGRRKVLLCSAITITLGHSLFAVGILMHSLPILFLGRLLAGIGDGVAGVFFATIADVTTKEERTRGFGIIASASGVGLILGAVISYLFSDNSLLVYGSQLMPLFILITLSIVNIPLIFLFLPETNLKPQELNISLLASVKDISNALIRNTSKNLYVLLLFFIISLTLFITYSPAFLVQEFKISQTSLSAVFILFGITIAVSQITIIPYILKIFHTRNIIPAALFTLSILVFLYTSVESPSILYLLVFLCAVCVGILYTSIMGLISISNQVNIQGRAMGLATSVQSFAQFGSGLLAGLVASYLGVTGPLFLSAIILLLTGMASFLILKKLA